MILSRFWPKSVKYPLWVSRVQKSHVLFDRSIKCPVLSALKAKGDVLFAPELGINLLWDGVWGRPSSAATARRAGLVKLLKSVSAPFAVYAPAAHAEIGKLAV